MRVGCGAVTALVVCCIQDTSMPVCESDHSALVVVGGRRLRRLYS